MILSKKHKKSKFFKPVKFWLYLYMNSSKTEYFWTDWYNHGHFPLQIDYRVFFNLGNNLMRNEDSYTLEMKLEFEIWLLAKQEVLTRNIQLLLIHLCKLTKISLYFFCFWICLTYTQISISHGPKANFNFTLEDALLPRMGIKPKSSHGH